MENELEDSGADILQLASHLEVLKILECPVCIEVPFPPIYNCVKGHIICHTCRPRLSSCVLCKDGFSEGRNYVAESIVLSSMHMCKFKHKGCQVQLDGHSMTEHLKICPARNEPTSNIESKVKINIGPNSNSKVKLELGTSSSMTLTQNRVSVSTQENEYANWTHNKLKLTIEISSNPQIIQGCRDELRRRLLSGFSNKSKAAQNLPESKISMRTVNQQCFPNNSNENHIPSAPTSLEVNHTFVKIILTNPIGLWYAHFEGEGIVRQLTEQRKADPILLNIGNKDSVGKMLELKLSETGYLDEPEAIITKEEFEKA